MFVSRKKSERQERKGGQEKSKKYEKEREKQDLSAALVPMGVSQMLVPSVSGHVLFEGRQLIKFSGPELDLTEAEKKRTRDTLTAATRQKPVQCNFKSTNVSFFFLSCWIQNSSRAFFFFPISLV